jgi:uncharacterized protein YjbI with pentapeptide repeats
MRKVTPEELKTILENHKHWRNEDCEGWEKMNADLSNADLRDADLRDADLRDADLRDADLSNADLRDADLIGANLSNADLRGANLIGADLRGANLIGANLIGADLRGADLRDAKGITMTCPSDGAFIGWKKAVSRNGFAIVKLQILDDAKRSSATGRKCRCDKAKVLAIYNQDNKEIDEAHSDRDVSFIYRPGEIVVPDSFDDNRWNECSNGIHFFITRQEAEEYSL